MLAVLSAQKRVNARVAAISPAPKRGAAETLRAGAGDAAAARAGAAVDATLRAGGAADRTVSLLPVPGAAALARLFSGARSDGV